MKHKSMFVFAGIVVLIIVGVALLHPLFSDKAESSGILQREEEPVPVEFTIACAGDVMIHSPQLAAQYDDGSGVYNFDNNFQYIKKQIEEADLSICNLETTFGGAPYTGYPTFSSPDELGKALADTGFDVIGTANNHMLDRGVVGLKRTLDVLSANELAVTGSVVEQEAPRYAMKEVKGIKIAVIAYTYETPSADSRVSINGSYISPEAAALINSFGYEDLDLELAKIKDVVSEAKNAGAELVVMYYHWGNEYQLTANSYQRYMTEQTVKNMDVDVIFGSHPHNLQEMEYYTRTKPVLDESGNPVLDEETGEPKTLEQKVPVFFSLGNFISNQREETVQNRYTEVGAIGRVTFQYMETKKKDGSVLRSLESVSMDAVPTWVNKYKQNGKDVYAIVPLDEGFESNETLAVSGHLSRAQKALEDANEVLGID